MLRLVDLLCLGVLLSFLLLFIRTPTTNHKQATARGKYSDAGSRCIRNALLQAGGFRQLTQLLYECQDTLEGECRADIPARSRAVPVRQFLLLAMRNGFQFFSRASKEVVALLYASDFRNARKPFVTKRKRK